MSEQIKGIVLDLDKAEIVSAAKHPPVSQYIADEQKSCGHKFEEVKEEGAGGEQCARGDKHLLYRQLIRVALIEIVHAMQDLYTSKDTQISLNRGHKHALQQTTPIDACAHLLQYDMGERHKRCAEQDMLHDHATTATAAECAHHLLHTRPICGYIEL